MWFTLAICLLSACESTNNASMAPDAAPSREFCNEKSRRAAAVMSETIASVSQCEVDADCKIVNFGASCVDCYWIIGNDTVKAALNAKSTEIEAICTEFHTAGCKVIASGCPPIASAGYQCLAGKCVYPSPSRKND
jgi:hypothetical protein